MFFFFFNGPGADMLMEANAVSNWIGSAQIDTDKFDFEERSMMKFDTHTHSKKKKKQRYNIRSKGV